MHRKFLLAAFFLVLGLSAQPVFAGWGKPDPPATRASGVPDFWQLDPRGNFANGGLDFCCPAAVSNSLISFAGRGYKNLLPDPDQPVFQNQVDLINLLASKPYFNTNPKNGTDPGELLRGLRKYVEERGYLCDRLEYEGWRSVGISQQSAVVAPLPKLNWLRQAINNPNGTAWLNVGWYEATDSPNEWKRIGGHWVTLVGFGDTDTPDSTVLQVHNSLINRTSGDSTDPASYSVTLTPLPEGKLITSDGSTRSTLGMYRVAGPGLPVKHGRVAFLDAAIVFVIGGGSK